MIEAIPTFDQIEHSIGGRPPKERKVRMSFYLTPQENQLLKQLAHERGICMSTLVRSVIKEVLLNVQQI